MNTTEKPLDYQGLNESMMKNCYAVFGMYRGLSAQFNCVGNIERWRFYPVKLKDNYYNSNGNSTWLPINYLNDVFTNNSFTINAVIRGDTQKIGDFSFFRAVNVFEIYVSDNISILLNIFGKKYYVSIGKNFNSKYQQTVLTISVHSDTLTIRVDNHIETHIISTNRPSIGQNIAYIIGNGDNAFSWNGYIDLISLWTGEIDAQALHNAPYSVFK